MPDSNDSGFAYFDPGPILLGLLTRGPRHGYQLYQEYQRSLADIWDLGRSRLYAVLNQLEEQGLLRVEVIEQQDKPPKKVHHLTEQGRVEFERWLRQPVVPLRSVRVPLLAKLRLFQELELEGRAQLIEAQIEVCNRVQEQELEPESGDQSQLIGSFRVMQAQFMSEWLKGLLEPVGDQGQGR